MRRGGTGRDRKRFPSCPAPMPSVREEDAAGAVIIMTKKWLVEVAARSVAGSSRTEQLAHERGPAAAAAQEVAGAGGPQSSQGGIWRCLMRCKVGVRTMIPPQHSWYIYTPHFYFSSAAKPFFTHQGCVLHAPAPPLCGGPRSPRRLMESRSLVDHVTLRPFVICLAPPEGGTRCKTKLLLP